MSVYVHLRVRVGTCVQMCVQDMERIQNRAALRPQEILQPFIVLQ